MRSSRRNYRCGTATRHGWIVVTSAAAPASTAVRIKFPEHHSPVVESSHKSPVVGLVCEDQRPSPPTTARATRHSRLLATLEDRRVVLARSPNLDDPGARRGGGYEPCCSFHPARSSEAYVLELP